MTEKQHKKITANTETQRELFSFKRSFMKSFFFYLHWQLVNSNVAVQGLYCFNMQKETSLGVNWIKRFTPKTMFVLLLLSIKCHSLRCCDFQGDCFYISPLSLYPLFYCQPFQLQTWTGYSSVCSSFLSPLNISASDVILFINSALVSLFALFHKASVKDK